MEPEQQCRVRIGEPRLGHGTEVLGKDGQPVALEVIRLEIDPIVPGKAVTARAFVYLTEVEVETGLDVIAVCPHCKAERRQIETSNRSSPDRVREYQAAWVPPVER